MVCKQKDWLQIAPSASARPEELSFPGFTRICSVLGKEAGWEAGRANFELQLITFMAAITLLRVGTGLSKTRTVSCSSITRDGLEMDSGFGTSTADDLGNSLWPTSLTCEHKERTPAIGEIRETLECPTICFEYIS
jgi:hypothetical protein